MDWQMEFAKITEAYLVEKDIPVKRKFTDAELEDAKDQLVQAADRLDQLDLPYDEYHPRPSTSLGMTEDQRLDDPHRGSI